MQRSAKARAVVVHNDRPHHLQPTISVCNIRVCFSAVNISPRFNIMALSRCPFDIAPV